MDRNTFKKNKKARSSNAKALILLASVVVIFSLLIGGTVLALVLHRPSVDDPPPFETGTTAENGDAQATTSVSGLPTADLFSRKNEFYTFLVAGVDDISMSTDVLMLASLNAQNGEIHIVQIPRDTFINKEVGGYANVTRINAVFTAAYNRARANGETESKAKHTAMQDLKARLSDSLCLNIDEYVLINTVGFRNVIDAVGGIWYDIPRDMDYEDPEQNLYIHLKAGYQHLDGTGCEQLIRYRSGYASGDIGRVELRGDFMLEAIKQVKGNIKLGTMLDMVPGLIGNVTTSMSIADILSYTRAAWSISDEKINVRTLTGSAVWDPIKERWSPYYCLNRQGALDDVNACLNVYVSDIPAEIFDQKGFFTDAKNEANAHLHDYYSS